MKSKQIFFYLIAPYLLSSCAYLQSASKQDEFAQSQETNPGQHNLKHIIDRDTFFVYGLILGGPGNQIDNPSQSLHTLTDFDLMNW